MKKTTLWALSALSVLSYTVNAADLKLTTDKEKLSYALGVQIGQDFKQRKFDINTDTFVVAIKDMLADKKPQLSKAEITAVFQKLQKAQMEMQQAASGENSKKGKAFLAKNKNEKGIITLDSGVQYRIITEGKGKRPSASNSVVAHYTGTLINGTVFDSSVERGEPATFPVNGVIKGWQEVLQLMKTGAKWKVFIPPELAYGERGAGADIGPNETLIFEIELLEIK